jgi:hypothetical protein
MTMPSEAKYRELLDGLRASATAFRAAESVDDDGKRDRLKAALSAFERVMLYLVSDSEVRDQGLLNPLGSLVTVLHNRERGAVAPQIDLRPDGAGDKPTGTMRELAQGSIAFGLQALKIIKQKEPSRWLAAVLLKEGVRTEGGGAITSGQINQWRYEIRREKAPRVAKEQYEALRKEFSAIRVEPGVGAQERARQRTHAFVRSIVLNLVHLGDVAPPRRVKQ